MSEDWVQTPPPWFSLTPAAVVADGLLLTDQFTGEQQEADLIREVERALREWAAVTVDRIRRYALGLALIADFNDDLSALLTATQKSRLVTATKFFVIADFQSRLTEDGAQDVSRAKSDGRGESITGGVRPTSGEALMLGLEADLEILAKARAGRRGAQSVAVKRENGCNESEYGGTSWFCKRQRS